jgi:hypothetical protein
MSGETTAPREAAPLVAAEAGQSESSLLRELVGDAGDYREEDMEDAGSEASSGLSELESGVGEEWEGKDRGRPNFRRAAPGAGQQQSTQEFFRRGNGGGTSGGRAHNDDDVFATPRPSVMRGALARSLSAAASSPQQVGTAQTLNSAKTEGEGTGMVGSKGVGGMNVAVGDWAEEMSNQSGDEMEGVAGPDRPETPTPPTPARWVTPTPVPVTPTKGKKRMAVGTPRPVRFGRAGGKAPPVGFAAASAMEQILAAVAGVERKLEEKARALEERMMGGMAAMTADADNRVARLVADAEERERRLAVKLLAMEGMESELMARGRWEIDQWKVWAKEMRERRTEIAGLRQTVDEVLL